jgi:hypothetical protein
MGIDVGSGVAVGADVGVGVGGALVGWGVALGATVADGAMVAAIAAAVGGWEGLVMVADCVSPQAPSSSASSGASVSRRSNDVFMPAL